MMSPPPPPWMLPLPRLPSMWLRQLLPWASAVLPAGALLLSAGLTRWGTSRLCALKMMSLPAARVKLLVASFMRPTAEYRCNPNAP